MTYYNKDWITTLGKIETVTKYDNHANQLIYYYNVPCAFDIETTSAYYQNEKFAYAYEYSFAIRESACYCRTMQDFHNLLKDLQLWLKLSPCKRLVVYVHNLGFEFQFLRKHFNWLKVFAVDDRKPIVAVTMQGIEFRDSYILSSYSLAKTADNLIRHDIRKLVGDLDYSLARHDETPLTEKELAYCENDVLIITAYIDEQIEQYGDITKIPLTNTGKVRRFVRENCLHDRKKKTGYSAGKRYRELMKECSLTLESYIYCHAAFQGGFTHASNQYSGITLENVHSVDFNSSYPYVMCSEKYPMGRPIPLEKEMFHMKHFKREHLEREYCYLLKIRIEGLHSKLTHECYLSESKCRGENIVASNGRIFQSDWIETTITDIDLDIILATYEYKCIQILGGYYMYKQYLPRTVIDSILTLYENKTNLKGVKGKETEYLVSKAMLNSVYGMCVTNIVRPDNVYENDEWQTVNPSIDKMQEMIDKDNSSRNRFLYYPWGVFVTAYARYNLWQGIINMISDYVYADTDSIKFLSYSKHTEYIDGYNKQCLEKLKAMCDFRKLDIQRCMPKGRVLGVFDYEGVSKKYKALGAKRYMTLSYDDEWKLTVAGLSKQNGMDYIREIAGGNADKAFELFDDNLSIPADRTGKQTHTYIDTPKTAIITDYLGNAKEVTALSGVHLESAPFELSITARYMEFLKAFRQGYILKRGFV